MKHVMSALLGFAACFSSAATTAQEDAGPTYQHLKELEHFVGDWMFKGPMVTGEEKQELSVVASYRWLQNKSFMLVTLEDTVTKELPYVAVIGWDPKEEHIMSWDFNLRGTIFSYRQGKNEDGWWIKGKGRMPDGATIEFTGLYKIVDADRMDYKGSGTIVRGEQKIPVTLEYTATRIKR